MVQFKNSSRDCYLQKWSFKKGLGEVVQVRRTRRKKGRLKLPMVVGLVKSLRTRVIVVVVVMFYLGPSTN